MKNSIVNLPYSLVTPKDVYLNRRRFLTGLGGLALGSKLATAAPALNAVKSPLSTTEKLTPLQSITTYNNVADPQTQTNTQPLARTAAQGIADQPKDLRKAIGLLGTFAGDAGQALTEDLPLADGVATTPTPHPQFQSHAPPLDGKIF